MEIHSSSQKLSLEVQGSTSMSSNEDEEEEKEKEEDELFYSWKNFKVRHGGAYWFMYLDDVVWFRDMNCGGDRNGRLYMLESEELYLVVRENVRVSQRVRFKVYKLDELRKTWDVVENIGHERVLFVGIDHCFCAMARHFPGCDGNSIVFASRSFTQYNGSDAPDSWLFDNEGTEVGVYRMGEGDTFRLLPSACPDFAGIIWPPPTWFCTRDNEELDISGHNYSRSRKKEVLDLRAAVPSIRVAVLIKQGVANSFVPTNQNLDVNHSTEVFEGLIIKSNLVQTLQKVWAKYGNILEGCMIRNTDMLAKALESLATALIILETSSGRSLNKTQADYLSSVLYDLQHMNFKVYWLVSFVENALTAYKSKPLIDSLMDFSQAKAQVAEMKLKLLGELAKLDEVEDMAHVSERLTVLESMDFDKSLGEGLY